MNSKPRRNDNTEAQGPKLQSDTLTRRNKASRLAPESSRYLAFHTTPQASCKTNPCTLVPTSVPLFYFGPIDVESAAGPFSGNCGSVRPLAQSEDFKPKDAVVLGAPIGSCVQCKQCPLNPLEARTRDGTATDEAKSCNLTTLVQS